MLLRKELLLAKIETTYGTDPTPVAADDSVWAGNVSLSPGMRELIRNLTSESISKPRSVIVPEPIEFTVTTELKTDGSADSGVSGNPLEIDALLRACGLAVTYSVGVDIEYTLVSSSFESITIWIYLDGMIQKITGCRGNLEIVCEVGEIAVCNFTFRGLWQIPIDGSIVSGTLDTNPPTKVSGATFTIGGYTPVAKGIQFNLGNVLTNRMDVTNAAEVREIMITDRDVRGSFEPEAVVEGTNTFWADLTGNVEAALVFQWGSAGDICKIGAPKLQFLSHGWGDRDSLRIYNTALKFNEDTGDDEIVLTFL